MTIEYIESLTEKELSERYDSIVFPFRKIESLPDGIELKNGEMVVVIDEKKT